MTVPAVNFNLDKGTYFEATFNVTNSDGSVFPLNNYTATAKVRKHPSSTSYQSFQTTITTAIGEIKVSMASTTTALLTSGRNYYDVIITQAGTNNVTKVFEGTVIVNDTVSV